VSDCDAADMGRSQDAYVTRCAVYSESFTLAGCECSANCSRNVADIGVFFFAGESCHGSLLLHSYL